MDALVPGFVYFAYWYMFGTFAFWFIGTETRGRTIDEIDTALTSREDPPSAFPPPSQRITRVAVRDRVPGSQCCNFYARQLGQRLRAQSSRHRKSGPSWSRLGQPIWPMTRSISVRKISTAFLTPGKPPATAP